MLVLTLDYQAEKEARRLNRICLGLVDGEPKVTFASIWQDRKSFHHHPGGVMKASFKNQVWLYPSTSKWTAPTRWHGKFRYTDEFFSVWFHHNADESKLSRYNFHVSDLRMILPKTQPMIKDEMEHMPTAVNTEESTSVTFNGTEYSLLGGDKMYLGWIKPPRRR